MGDLDARQAISACIVQHIRFAALVRYPM